MTVSRAVRQVHRWLSIIFPLGVLLYVVAMSRGRPPAWLGVFPLLPLVVLLATGLYLFVLPYVAAAGRRRDASR